MKRFQLMTALLCALSVPALAQEQSPSREADRPQPGGQEQQSDQEQQSEQTRQTDPQQEASQSNRDRQAVRSGSSQQAETAQRPFLGIGFARDARAEQGLRVGAVLEGSAAQEANLRSGDVIVSVDGQQINSPEQLDRLVQQRQIGDTVEMTVIRNGEEQQIQATLTEMPEQARRAAGYAGRPDFGSTGQDQRGWLGVTLQSDGTAAGAEGVTIQQVYPAGPAARAGLQQGDRILEVEGQAVRSTDELLNVLGQHAPEETVELVVVTDGDRRTINARLGDRSVFASADENASPYLWRDPSGFRTEISEHDMFLEQHRRLAEQHERLETLLREIQQDLKEIKAQLGSGGNDSGSAGTP